MISFCDRGYNERERDDGDQLQRGPFSHMVKKLMRLHTRSISAAHPAVHDTELRLQALGLG
jgi:hypothetical protein